MCVVSLSQFKRRAARQPWHADSLTTRRPRARTWRLLLIVGDDFPVWQPIKGNYHIRMTRHCWKCNTEYKLARSPGRSETCDRCGADLKVCLNCVSYDLKLAYQCRDRRAELVEDKRSANYCEYFELARRVFVPPEEDVSRQESARAQLKKLLGD